MKKGMMSNIKFILLSLFLIFVIISVSSPVVSASSFNSTWNTSKTSFYPASSNSTTIALPLTSDGIYNFTVNWGDGTSDSITSYNQPEVNHTYSTAGVYNVSINGTIVGFNFYTASINDALKLIDISNWGDLNVGNDGYYFYGCSNLVGTATDALNLTGSPGTLEVPGVPSTTDLSLMFAGDSKFNMNISSWNTSLVTKMGGMFDFNGGEGDPSCLPSVFNSDISNWDTSSVTEMSSLFSCATNFNGDISNWDTSKVIGMSGMFLGASSFNQNLSNWNVSSVTSMYSMFQGATAFNQNLSNWNVSSVTSMYSMFQGAKLSTSNYDSLLNGWASLPSLQTGVTFDAGNSTYSLAARNARNDTLINVNGWAITDGGFDASPTYSLNQTNNSFAGQPTLFSVLWDDDVALNASGQYIFSTNNSGVWVNDSAINFTATPNWANVTKVLNSTVGVSVGYMWYADDNSGIWNSTKVFSLIIKKSPILIQSITYSGVVGGPIEFENYTHGENGQSFDFRVVSKNISVVPGDTSKSINYYIYGFNLSEVNLSVDSNIPGVSLSLDDNYNIKDGNNSVVLFVKNSGVSAGRYMVRFTVFSKSQNVSRFAEVPINLIPVKKQVPSNQKESSHSWALFVIVGIVVFLLIGFFYKRFLVKK